MFPLVNIVHQMNPPPGKGQCDHWATAGITSQAKGPDTH